MNLVQRKMKPSGVDWIGDVPEGWGIDKFCYRFDFAKGLNITKQDLTETGVPVVSYGQIHSKRNDGVHLTDELLRHISAELTKGEYAARLKRNDFVFADTSEDVEGIGNCVTVNRDEAIYAGYHTLVARPIEKVNCGYFGYLFKSECWRQQLRRKANSVKVYSISQRLFKGVSILLPPLDEQKRIAAKLDRLCGRVDELAENIKGEIAALQEYRKSLITECVTKGLNPKAKMKPSGVDWIGGVPEGWGIDKFCYRFDFAKGLNITKQDLTETGVPVVSYGQIHSKRNDGVHLTDELLRHIPVELTKGEYAARLKRNDFVFADTSEDVEGIGNCVTVNRDEVIYAGYHTLVARPIEKVNCGYFGYLFKSECWRQQLRRKANSVKVYSISQRLFKGVSILLPPLDEQSRIATFLDKRCAVIDAKIAERQKQLEKLGEYRSSVIYEYVTGKREVLA